MNTCAVKTLTLGGLGGGGGLGGDDGTGGGGCMQAHWSDVGVDQPALMLHLSPSTSLTCMQAS